MTKTLLIPTERIEHSILLIRGQKVMLDSDLAELYGVETKRLNEQIRRNIKRFPSDFMFQLNEEEFESLRSQFATLKKWWSQTLTVKSRSYHLEVTNCDFKTRSQIATSRFKVPKWNLKMLSQPEVK